MNDGGESVHRNTAGFKALQYAVGLVRWCRRNFGDAERAAFLVKSRRSVLVPPTSMPTCHETIREFSVMLQPRPSQNSSRGKYKMMSGKTMQMRSPRIIRTTNGMMERYRSAIVTLGGATPFR